VSTQSKDGRAEALRRAIRLKKAAARSRTPGPAGVPSQERMGRRPEDREARLGELQRSLWLLHRLQPGSPAYNLTSAFRVQGELRVPDLQRAFNGVVARHRILRSTFRPDRDGVRQVVHPPAPLMVKRVRAEDGGVVAAGVREAREPFDLEAGPLIRLLLVEEPSGGERLLVLVLHHILADERSLGRLWKEIAEGYAGRAPAVAEVQYDDFVHWSAERTDPDQRAAEIDAWRHRLDPPPEDLALPFERASEAEPLGRWLGRPLGHDVTEGIRRVAASAGTTPFAVFAFAFRLLLHRYTDGRDVAFATPASRRSHPATAEMVGYFLDPVVVRIGIDEARSVEDAVRGFSRELRDGLAHASVPFDVLAEALSPRRRPGRHPIFQAMFVYQETPAPPELGGARLEPVTLDLGESKFDLTLFVSEGRTSEIAVEYRADRFDDVWMQNLLGHYETLIGNLTEHLDRLVAEVPMLRTDEEDELRGYARGPALEAADPASLPEQIFAQARRSADAPAVAGGGETWTYGELEAAARGIAGELARHGVEPGDRVGLFVDRSPWMIAGLLGIHAAGAAYVPLDPAYPSDRNRDVLDGAEVAAVLTGATVRDLLPAGPWPLIDVGAHGCTPVGGVPDRAALPEGAASPTRAHSRAPLQETGAAAGGAAYVLYTSGSTGRPKGVVVTHDNLRVSNAARVQVYGTAAGQRFLLLPSIAFDSSVAGLFWTLAGGGTLVLPTGDELRDPRRLARRVDEEQVTSLLCVPSLYAHLLATGADLGSLEIVIVAGESCPARLVEEHFRRLPRTRLFNEYGPTEATVWAAVHEIEPQDDPVPIGRPIPGVRVEVLDELGRRVPAGVPGQGWIAGPTLAEGYRRRPELTEEHFVRRRVGDGPEERMVRTGDRMVWTADGKLLFLGRVDEQVKLRGFRIEPGEVETALLAFPGIAEAAVVLRDGQLTAFVLGAGIDADELRRELAKRLPGYMVPGRIVALAELPRLPNGKVDRGRLREMPLDPEAPAEEASTILGEREQALVSLWEGLLGRTGIRPADNFFQLGGHSLLAVEMASAIERDFGAALTPADVFQHPTVAELAGLVERQGGPDAPAYAHLFPIQPGGHGDPFVFCVPHFFSAMAAERFRGERPVYGLRGVSLRPEGNRGRWPTMRELGAELVDEVRRRFPDEAFVVAGYSFGATMAVEAVRQMEERGLPVRRLILIAPMAVDFYRLGPLRVQLDGLRRPLDELSLWQALGHFLRGNHPLTRRPYRRLWRLLAVQPWRRLLCAVGRLRTLAGLPLTPRILHADVRVERFRLHAAYRPGIVRSPTVVFNASEPETDAAATWRPFFAGPFTVHQIPDPHLDEASVRTAREQILGHLGDL
jgi:amino acid adenylation domain-containing protein